MPKDTPLDAALSRQIRWYSAAAGVAAIAAAPSADAQVVYTDLDPDLVVQDTFTGTTFSGEALDLDGDGDAEIAFGEQGGGNYTLAQTTLTADGDDTVTAIVGNIVPFMGDNFAYFLPLNSGDSIGPANATLTGYGLATFTFAGSDPNGFIGTGDVFIGVQFDLNTGTTHYAWVQLEIPAGGGQIIVKDYAFESTPDTPIEAGDRGIVAIEPGPDGTPGTHALSAALPNPSNGRTQLALEVAQTQHVTVAVYNALGQQVALLHEGALAAGAAQSLTFDGSGLASGVYVVRVTGETFSDVRTLTLAR